MAIDKVTDQHQKPMKRKIMKLSDYLSRKNIQVVLVAGKQGGDGWLFR